MNRENSIPITKENLLKIGFCTGKHDHIFEKYPIEVNTGNHNTVTIYGHVTPCETINDIDRLYFALTKKQLIQYDTKEIARHIFYEIYNILFDYIEEDSHKESTTNELSIYFINEILKFEKTPLYLDVKKEIKALINWTNFDFLQFHIDIVNEWIDKIKDFKDSIYFCGYFIRQISKKEISNIKFISYCIDLINLSQDKEMIISDLESFKSQLKDLAVGILKKIKENEQKEYENNKKSSL